MDPRNNPFTPAFGTTPLVMAGRQQIIQDVRLAFDQGPGNPNLSTILIGARGTGKTVCMSRIAEEAMECGWVCVKAVAVDGMLEDIYEQAVRAATTIVGTEPLRHLTSMSVGPVSASWDTQAPPMGNWRSRMTDLIQRIEESGSGLLITVDEVRADLGEMITLAAVFQLFVVEQRKVALVMAGLPYHVHQLLSDKSVSFLRRSMQYQLGRIPDADIREAFLLTLKSAGSGIEKDALDSCVHAIDGFAYMLQLVGYRAWRAAHDDAIITHDAARAGIAAAWDDMENHILASTYLDLSQGDVLFLEAMTADNGVSSQAVIAKRMGVTSRYASNYKARLLAQGVIAEVSRGKVEFAIPGMREYVREHRGKG